jgi:DNA replication and repair protein RecF
VYLNHIELKNFRNYRHLSLDLSRGTTVITGDNGQGKTNFLESIYYLSSGKSHRTASQKEIITDGQDYGLIRASVANGPKSRLIEIELRRDNSYRLRIDKVYSRKKSEFTSIVSAVIFSPDDLNLVKGSPIFRRNYLDNMLDITQKGFSRLRLQYQKTLNQRNSLIKSMNFKPGLKPNATVEVWNQNLIGYGLQVMEYRLGLIAGMEEEFKNLVSYFFPDSNAQISYVPSWNRSSGLPLTSGQDISQQYARAMEQSWDKDLALKTTSTGPHRDDLVITLQGSDLRSFGSQGQQRIAAVALRLCELFYLKKEMGQSPVLLLDDVMSELDVSRKRLLIEKLKDGFQTFITAAHINYLEELPLNIAAYYQVKDGRIIQQKI